MKKSAFLLLTTVSLFLISCTFDGSEPGHDNSIINAKACFTEDCNDTFTIQPDNDPKQPAVVVTLKCKIGYHEDAASGEYANVYKAVDAKGNWYEVWMGERIMNGKLTPYRSATRSTTGCP